MHSTEHADPLRAADSNCVMSSEIDVVDQIVAPFLLTRYKTLLRTILKISGVRDGYDTVIRTCRSSSVAIVDGLDSATFRWRLLRAAACQTPC